MVSLGAGKLIALTHTPLSLYITPCVNVGQKEVRCQTIKHRFALKTMGSFIKWKNILIYSLFQCYFAICEFKGKTEKKYATEVPIVNIEKNKSLI